MIIKILILAIAMRESATLDSDAYNARENAVGVLQVRPCVITDINRRYGTDFKHKDMRDADKAAWVFRAYGKMYGAETPEQYARIWNGGPDGAEEQCTEDYWKAVKRNIRTIISRRRKNEMKGK